MDFSAAEHIPSFLNPDANAVNKNVKASHAKNLNNKQQHHDKIQTLKNQIEKQMKTYIKQEEYDEMLKLVKVSN